VAQHSCLVADLTAGRRADREGIEAADVAIDPWQPEQAAREFLERYARLNSAPESRAT
jgi:hypothetical protein